MILNLISKRLQVILADEEMRQIQQLARREKMTVAEWVRQALRAARSKRPSADAEKKIQAIRAAARHSFPTAVTGVVDEVLPIAREDAERAKELLLGAPRLSARGALHAAVIRRRGLKAILSFDAGFDECPGIRRRIA